MIGCSSKRTIDGWTVHCNRGDRRHTRHGSVLLCEGDGYPIAYVEWSDSASWSSDAFMAVLTATRDAMRAEAAARR